MILQFVSEKQAERFYSLDKILRNNTQISKPEDVLKYFGRFFENKRQEYFCCLNLDGANNIISSRIITIGLINHSPVHPREVFRDAILDSAVSMILVHNHPSGSITPSQADRNITDTLVNAGNIIGIEIVDHIIIGKKNGHMSFKAVGYI